MVIGDPHAHPRLDNDRFEELGRFAMQQEVDHVHCVGDWTDFPSLNEHKSVKEQRPDLYKDDLEAGNDALVRFDEGLAGWTPTKSISLGNHDVYPSRWISGHPKFEGIISPSDIKHKEHGWKTTGFEEGANVRGLWVSHHFPSSGSSNRAQSGIHVAHQNLNKQGLTCVFGHNHRYDHKIKTIGDGSKQHSFSAGCMNHPRYNEPWCRATKKHWDRGVLLIKMYRGRVVGFAWRDYPAMRRSL